MRRRKIAVLVDEIVHFADPGLTISLASKLSLVDRWLSAGARCARCVGDRCGRLSPKLCRVTVGLGSNLLAYSARARGDLEACRVRVPSRAMRPRKHRATASHHKAASGWLQLREEREKAHPKARSADETGAHPMIHPPEPGWQLSNLRVLSALPKPKKKLRPPRDMSNT